MMLSRLRPNPTDTLTVPDKVRRRARRLLEFDPVTVIDQSLHAVWVAVSARDYDRAVAEAEVLLSVLVEMRDRPPS